jgi:glycosyltransferase involved in cell wall biosynthesis
MDPLIVHLGKVAGIAGSEGHLLSLLPGLRERGWKVHMAMLHEREAGAARFARELRRRGVPVDAIRLRGDIDPLAAARLAGYLVHRRPALLHTHLVHADLYGQLAGALVRVPLRVSSKHGFNDFRERRGFAFVDRAAAGLAHAHIAASRGLARYLAATEGFVEDRFEIVPYGIAAGDDATAYAGPPRIICVGRMIPMKGHIVLLRALAAARRRVPEIELKVAGQGPLEPTVRALSKELALEDRVRFVGHVAPIQRALEDASVVVVPSLGEGFGMVALEAMERARPVIASAIGGLADIVRDGETGLLVPPGEAEALAHAIVELASHPERAAQMGEAGRRRALRCFPEAGPVDRVETLYRSLLASRRPSSPEGY